MITCDQCREELAEYALGRAPAATTAAMAEHVAACPVCRHELAALEAAWSALPLALDLQSSPPALFDRIVAKIDSQSPRVAPRTIAASPARRQPSLREKILSYVLAGSVLIGLTAGYFRLLNPGGDAAAQASVERLAQRLGKLQQEEAERLLNSDNVRLVSLHRPETPTSAQAYVVWDLAAHQWHFYASDLPAPAEGSVYQLWAATKAGELVPGPTFDVNAEGLGSVVADLPSLDPSAAAKAVVTLEPRGGSKQPTGNVLLEAAL